MSGPGDFWRETDLWRQLEALDGGPGVAAAVAQHLPTIERVLAQAATSPRHFTLHDAQHSWRVAQQMRRLIPDDVWDELSAYELALLLLSAYLHDIGMTPAQRMVSAHHELLVDGGSDALDDAGVAAFQEWLDRTHPGVEIAAAKGTADVERMREIDLLVSAYVRHRHVDWSEEWMRAQLPDELLPGYPQALEDLVALCRSHHDGLRALTESAFDPTFLDGGAVAVHRRYLAAVLRVADVLDVDPERTPAVIFQHRDVAAQSVVYWHKDHDLSISVERSGRVIAEAAPRSAVIHRAIEETIEQIDAELRLVQALHVQTPFDVAPMRTERLPHRWDLDPMVQSRIEPKDRAYEYVNGAFRPDTKKVLDLLGAVQLYGDELSALRELVQNALDAVRERMAWQRLRFGDQQALLAALLDSHEIVLTLARHDDGRLWLECDDGGSGMTKEILTEHYLISGRGPTHEVLELRRAARAHAIPFERTGQFGIGVLSYFMLADRVVLETRRCDEAPSPEGTAWSFETNGVGSFGELRRGTRSEAGTRLALRLRSALTEAGADELWKRIERYLEGQLLVLPCRVRLRGPGGEERILPAGWTAWLHQVRSPLDQFTEREVPAHLQGPQARLGIARRADQRRAYADAAAAARWHTVEDDLPDGLGRFRFAFPYFERSGGVCLAFLRSGSPAEDGRIPIEPIAVWPLLSLEGEAHWSWHGILVPFVMGHEESAFRRTSVRVVIDLRDDRAGRLDVSRNRLRLDDAGRAALEHVRRRVALELRRFLDDHAESRFHALNVRLANSALAGGGEQTLFDHSEWLTVTRDGADEARLWWEPIRYPIAVSDESVTVSGSDVTDLLLGEERVRLVGELASAGIEQNLKSWADRSWVPDRLVADRGDPVLLRVFDRRPRRAKPDPLSATTTFPPPLRGVIGLAVGTMLLLNEEHPVVAALDQAAIEWSETLDWEADQLERREEILSSDAHAAAWLVALFRRSTAEDDLDAPDLWGALAERDPRFIEALSRRLHRDADATTAISGEGFTFLMTDFFDLLYVATLGPSRWTVDELADSPAWVVAWNMIPEDWRLRRVDE